MKTIRVEEIAKKLNVNVDIVIKKLNKKGYDIKDATALIDENVAKKIISENKKQEEEVHIVRRNVKIVNTNEKASNTDKALNDLDKKDKKEVPNAGRKARLDNINKEGKMTRKNVANSNRNKNRMANIVVTKNGVKVENTSEPKVVEKVVEKIANENNKVEPKVEEKEILNKKDVSKEQKVKNNEEVIGKTSNTSSKLNEQQVENKNISNGSNNETKSISNTERMNDNTKDRQNRRENTYSNNANQQKNKYSADYHGRENKREYQNNNSNGNNSNNNSRYSSYNNRKDFKNPTSNSNNTYNKPYQDRPDRKFNNNGYNRNNGNLDNNRLNRQDGGSSSASRYNNRGYSSNNNGSLGANNASGNNFRSGFKKPGYNNVNSTTYKVNKFLKEQVVDTIQKDTRDYSTALIDKKKYNEEKPLQENRRDKKNSNVMREQDSRMDFGKLRGMQVSEEGLMDLYERGENRKSGGKHKKEKAKIELNTTKIIPLTDVELPEIMTVKDLAETLKKQASEVIKKLFMMGIMATVNQEIDFDTAFLIASEFGINATKKVVVTEEDVLFDDSEDDEKDLTTRPPIITIMGHVDHGKTSLLDKIRKSNVAVGESGGITQHIGAYKVKINNREITFLDTPGHEAFTAMRARGAQITDIVVIVVAADDSIKPQTVEAINHAKAANVPIIIAINKIDKEGANIDKVKQDLLEYDLVTEEWGGDTICVPLSAKTGEGIDNLLEMILLVADMKELKSNPNKQAKGTVIEAKLDKSRGPLASVLVQRGTLNVGDMIVVGDTVGRIRAMTNDKGEKVKLATPSTPVEILGLSVVPETGEVFYEVTDEKMAHKLIAKRKAEHRLELIKHGSAVTLDELYSKIKDETLKNLDIVIRADVQGSVEALKASLEKLSNDEVRVRVIAGSTGTITESDIMMASLSNALVIGFNTKLDSTVKHEADKKNVDVRMYSVIYDAIDDVTEKLNKMLKPIYKEVVLGSVEVRQLFKVSSIGVIAGSYVKSGKVTRNSSVRVYRNDAVICDCKIDSLKREKDDVKEVTEGYECGIKLEKFNELQVGDILECYEMQEEKRG